MPCRASRHQLFPHHLTTDPNTTPAWLRAALRPPKELAWLFMWSRFSCAAHALQGPAKLIPASPCSDSVWQRPLWGNASRCILSASPNVHCCSCISAEPLIPQDPKHLLSGFLPSRHLHPPQRLEAKGDRGTPSPLLYLGSHTSQVTLTSAAGTAGCWGHHTAHGCSADTLGCLWGALDSERGGRAALTAQPTQPPLCCSQLLDCLLPFLLLL